MSDTINELEQMKGTFVATLLRNNKKIREDRALVIVESAELNYKRMIEDLEIKIKKMKRERDGMLDLSPTTADSLVLASDFDGESFSKTDLRLGVEIRNLEIQLEIAKERYNELFK